MRSRYNMSRVYWELIGNMKVLIVGITWAKAEADRSQYVLEESSLG